MKQHEDQELKELLEAIDIGVFLDREGITYRPTMGSRGPQYNVRECPVCGDDRWKVYINRETGLGNCFAGDHPQDRKGYNKWSFIRAYLGEGVHAHAVKEFIKRLARETGWKSRRVTSVETKVEKGSPELPASYAIPIKGRNLAYLENRGIDAALAHYFNWRFCLNGYHRYRNDSGLWQFQWFSNRIIIPVFDLDGTLVSFQGRDILGTQDPKYLFPVGYAVTGAHLYNGHNVVGTRRVVMGEGAFDVAATKAALDGDPALRDVVPIGSFGKHLSFGTEDSQLEKFRRLKDERGLEEVTIMWDGEIPATDQAIESGDLLRSIGLRVRIAMLPPLKDPNEVPAATVREAFYRATLLDKLSGAAIAIERRQMNAAASHA